MDERSVEFQVTKAKFTRSSFNDWFGIEEQATFLTEGDKSQSSVRRTESDPLIVLNMGLSHRGAKMTHRVTYSFFALLADIGGVCMAFHLLLRFLLPLISTPLFFTRLLYSVFKVLSFNSELADGRLKDPFQALED